MALDENASKSGRHIRHESGSPGSEPPSDEIKNAIYEYVRKYCRGQELDRLFVRKGFFEHYPQYCDKVRDQDFDYVLEKYALNFSEAHTPHHRDLP